MPLEIRSAASDQELEELFHLRYQVFVEEMKYYPANPDRQIVDDYDRRPTTRNFLARIGGRIVGGMRTIVVEGSKTPIDDFFNYRAHIPASATKVLAAGMLFVLPGHRRLGRTATAILTLLADYALGCGASCIIAAVSPDAERLAHHQGYRYLAPRFFHAEKHLWVAPMMLELSARQPQASSEVDDRQYEEESRDKALGSRLQAASNA